MSDSNNEDTLNHFYNIFFAIHQLNTDLLKKINTYKEIVKNSDNIKDRFYKIEIIYMHSIILDMAKITSAGTSDKSGVKNLQNISPSEIKQEIENLLENNKHVLDKIKVNRDKIVAHLDVGQKGYYIKLGFSKSEVDKISNDYKKYLKESIIIPDQKDLQVISKFQKMKSLSIDSERYSSSDFYNDLPIFKLILKEIIKIANNLNSYYTKNK